MKYGIIQNEKGETLKLSKIILGTAVFGTKIPKETAFEMMDTYFAHGGRVLDTARVYSDWLPNGHGASERTIGEWIQERNCRKDIILSTKGAHPSFSDMHRSRMTAEEIYVDLNESLKTLQTDYVDIYYLHRDDENIPVSEIMDILDPLVKSGKIRMLGASYF